MKLNIFVIALILPFLTVSPLNIETNLKPVSKEVSLTSENHPKTASIETKRIDPRAEILRDYLAQYNSPLQNHAQDFVEVADKNNMDWRLVPSIAGVESTFGKHTPGGDGFYTPSYNGWGWGVYGNQALYFESWRDGIETVSFGLKKNYIDKGLDDPYKMNRVYAASPTWGTKVSYFLNDLDEFAKNHPSIYETNGGQNIDVEAKQSGNSAKLKKPIFKVASK